MTENASLTLATFCEANQIHPTQLKKVVQKACAKSNLNPDAVLMGAQRLLAGKTYL